MAQEGRNREQEETGCQQPAGHVLCANNCGLFGSEATLNFCLKCYQEVVLRKAKAFSSSIVGERSAIFPLDEKPEKMIDVLVPVVQQEQAEMACCGEISSAFPSIGSCEQRHHSVKIPSRCASCRKRVGLTGFKCRCGDLFCAVHRYSDKHSCSFDYKAAARHEIAKANPLIKADKIQRI